MTCFAQAKVLSQLVILALLTQYLLAPKIAESMRQRAIMLCRAFTTTESQGVKFRVHSPYTAGTPQKHLWPQQTTGCCPQIF